MGLQCRGCRHFVDPCTAKNPHHYVLCAGVQGVQGCARVGMRVQGRAWAHRGALGTRTPAGEVPAPPALPAQTRMVERKMPVQGCL